MATTEALQARYAPQPLEQITVDRQLHCARFSPCGKFLIGGDFEGKIRRLAIQVEPADEPAEGEQADGEQTDQPKAEKSKPDKAEAVKAKAAKKKEEGDAEPAFRELPPLEGHHGWVQPVEFAAESGLMFTADSWGRISAWSYADENPGPKWTNETAHDGWVRCLSVSPDGRHLASCGMDGVVRIWTTADGKPVRELTEHGEDVFSVAYHPGGKFLVSGDLKGVVKKWNAATGECVGEFDAKALYLYDRIQDVGGVWCLRFDRQGKTLACAGVKPDRGATVQGVPTALLFDFESGRLLHTLSMGAAKDCYVHDLLLHDAGFVVAVTSGTPGTGQVLLHKPGDEKPFFVSTKIANCHSVSLHPDGRRLAVVSTNKGSNGNGRRLNKDGEYEGNHSPIQIFTLTAAE